MNKYDSELIAGILTDHGFRFTEEREDADAALINTCGVREHAENRALSDLSRMLAWKKRKRGRVVGILGCLSPLIGTDLLKRYPDLDFAVGPDGYRELPQLLSTAFAGGSKSGVLLADPSTETYGDVVPAREPGVRAWVAVSRGCDKGCSYCMVPLARGGVRNRPVAEIVREVEALVADGYPEVILLGQNVNAYRVDDIGFGGLLRAVARVRSLKRVRFMTSHPMDLNDDLIDALSEGGVICPDLHLPVQSGSDRILERMNRGYSRSHYLRLVEKLRDRIPGIALSTDAIVGFPGESDADFEQTLSLFETAGYASGFVFRFSPRPGTTAAGMEDDVPGEVKTERLIALNDALERSRSRIHRSLIGKTLNVLIEGEARKHPDQMTGRSREGYIIAIPKNELQPGQEVSVVVERSSGFTLLGKPVS